MTKKEIEQFDDEIDLFELIQVGVKRVVMGIPIVHGVRGESADIVKDSGCGIVFKPGNSEDLTKKIIYLKENPEEIKKLQKNCLKISKDYNRKDLSQKMLGYISTLLEK